MSSPNQPFLEGNFTHTQKILSAYEKKTYLRRASGGNFKNIEKKNN